MEDNTNATVAIEMSDSLSCYLNFQSFATFFESL